MRFPKSEAEVRALAQRIISGLAENPDFPSPPVSSSDLRNALDAFVSASDAPAAAQAAAEQATEVKQTTFEELISLMKSVLRYAEDAVHGNDAKLSMLGWGGRSPITPLVAPSQPLMFAVTQQGAGWVVFRWKQPADGGEVAYYKILRREHPEDEWDDAGSSIETEVRLNRQERGKVMEYCAISVNKAGESTPGNTVTVTL